MHVEVFELILMLLLAVLLSSILDQVVPRISSPLIQIAFGIGNGENKKYRRNQKLLFGDQGRIENHCGIRNPFSKQS